MPYKILGHTADIRLFVEGKDLEELFKDSLSGMMRIIDPRALKDRRETKRRVNISAADETALLIDFLNEVLFNAEEHREFYSKVDFQNISSDRLEAVLIGRLAESFSKDIKAVTYHEANIIKNKKGDWETMIVFDI